MNKKIALHPDLQSGFDHLFKIEGNPPQAANIGKRCRYKNPVYPIHYKEFTIGSLQKDYAGRLCYRIYFDGDTFGQVAGLDEVDIIEPMSVEEFERQAYEGYTSYGYSMSDGIYRPLHKETYLNDLRKNRPLPYNYFQYGTNFDPTPADIEFYNSQADELKERSGKWEVTFIRKAQRGYFEHDVYGEGGGLWFENDILIDYDGVTELPIDVVKAIAKLQLKMDAHITPNN